MASYPYTESTRIIPPYDENESINRVFSRNSAKINIFQARSSGGDVISDSYTDLDAGWGLEDINTGVFSWNSSTGQLTIDVGGTLEISAYIQATATISNRIQLGLKIQINEGSGFVDIAGAEDQQYAMRNTTLQEDGSAQINNYILLVNSGDIIKLQHIRSGAGCNITNARISAKLYT